MPDMHNASVSPRSHAQKKAYTTTIVEQCPPKKQSFEKPIILVRDSFLTKLHIGFEVYEFSETEKLPQERNVYIFDDCDTSEVQIRKAAWKLGRECSIHSVRQSLDSLSGGSKRAAAELSEQVIEFAQPYKDWSARRNDEPLTINDAREIAEAAYKSPLNDIDRQTELATLAARVEAYSKAAGYQWSKIVGRLEDEFRKELQSRGLSEDNSDDDERLRLALLELSQEKDEIKYIRKRAQICSHYRISKPEVEKLIKITERKTATNSLQRQSFDELLDMEIQELSWMIPELLPKGEMVVLAGSPKCGKTLMAIDAAFAIATGEDDFLGLRTQQGKVLLISNDENARSTKSKLLKRGFRKGDGKNLEVIFNWNINQLYELEGLLDEFRPDVVIVDSLKSITACNAEVSENSAEFANNIYALKNLLNQYNAASILIHHTNKNKDAMGVHKLRGSSAIAGAVWGTWQLDHIPTTDPNDKKKQIIDPRDPKRILAVHARDVEGQLLKLEFDAEHNSFERIDKEVLKESQKLRDRIINVLQLNPEGLSGRWVVDCLGMQDNKYTVYSELNRMEDKKIISIKQSNTDRRVRFYKLKNLNHVEKNIKQPSEDGGDSLSPPPCVPLPNKSSESITDKKIQDIKQKNEFIKQESEFIKQDLGIEQNHEPAQYLNPLPHNESSSYIAENTHRGGEGVPLKLFSFPTECEIKQTPQPQIQLDNQPISVLKIKQTGGDISGFIGCNLEIRGMTGLVISRGVMIDDDDFNRVIIFETEKGDRKKASYREAYVIN
ncbi:MAG: AAA family ATPase [Rivularia sp. (in: cyanobacteria)]